MEQPATARHYALLIGINAYPESPLKGCVRDVQDIKSYLEQMPHPIHIQTFTASGVDASSHLPAEPPELWPTYSNVVSGIRRVTSSAQLGDFVYIHFSGHGTTTMPTAQSPDQHTNDLALVLLEVKDKIDIRYLRGLELAYPLKEMVDKGIIVTLVLDCCFSGSVSRKSPDVRYIEFDPEIDAAYPPTLGQSLITNPEASRPLNRSVSMRSNWLVNPDGYTLLTACGPTETAKELVLKNGQRHGALSYFLVRTFHKLGGVGGRQQHLYHHLRARFRASGQKQNPMFYGNNNLCFFGPTSSDMKPIPIPLIRKSGGRIQLDAGEAHGISLRDRFAVSPLGPEEDELTLKHTPVIATVTRVGALNSDVEISGMAPGDVESGWLATPLTFFSLQRFPIRLELGLTNSDAWTKALQEQQSLMIYDGDPTDLEYPTLFRIVPNDGHGYEIRDQSNQQIAELPITGQDQEANARYVLDVMVHIARFNLVRDLTNARLSDPAYSFRDSFTVQIIDPAGKAYQPGCLHEGWFRTGCSHPDCTIEVQNDEKLELRVENKGSQTLYTHVYNLGHNWEIENILRGNHEVIPPKATRHTPGQWRRKLKMVVSPEVREQGRSQYEDIIKVFLTVQPTSFASLELPELVTPAEGGKKEGRIEKADHLPDDWAAVNFRIRTCVEVEADMVL